MTDSWNDARPQSAWFNFKQVPVSSDWFQVYEIAANLFVFYEPRHYEQTLVNLIIGQDNSSTFSVSITGSVFLPLSLSHSICIPFYFFISFLSSYSHFSLSLFLNISSLFFKSPKTFTCILTPYCFFPYFLYFPLPVTPFSSDTSTSIVHFLS